MKKRLDFKDINLVPNMGIVNSRSECDTTIKFGGYSFKMPVVPSNMSSVISEELAQKLARNNYFYIMHRFDIDIVQFMQNMTQLNLFTSISIGVNEDSFKLIDELELLDLEPDFITIDIAHGHSIKMKAMIQYIKSKFNNTFVIAGNISSPIGVMQLQEWGADAIKVGISGGAACTTNFETGFGNRNCAVSMLIDCVESAKVPLIMDGGIQHPGDICKSLAIGATMVMVGNLLSGCTDSPGDIITDRLGNKFKEYYGSASQFQSGKTNRIEGTKKLIELKENNIIEQLLYLTESLQSGISYAGGKDLSAFNNVKWV